MIKKYNFHNFRHIVTLNILNASGIQVEETEKRSKLALEKCEKLERRLEMVTKDKLDSERRCKQVLLLNVSYCSIKYSHSEEC